MSNHHRILHDDEIPDPLKRKLIFGDREQIQALKEIDSKLEALNVQQELLNAGNLKRFQVIVDIDGRYETEIYATSKEAAIEKVREDFDADMTDLDFYWHANQLKNSPAPESPPAAQPLINYLHTKKGENQ